MNNINLIKGDCIDAIDNLPNESIDVVLTDPPYGINYKSNKQCGDTRHGKEIKVRDKSFFEKIQGDDFLPLEWIKHSFDKIKVGGAIYIFCQWKKWSELESFVKSSGFMVKNMIVVNKSNHGMGDLAGSYAPKHELILFASKGRHILDNSELGRGKDVFDGKVLFSGSHRYHPNEKPVSWLEPIIKRSCPANGTVLDPFMGSGTTGVVCNDLNRNFIGIEIDDDIFKTAQERCRDKKVANFWERL